MIQMRFNNSICYYIISNKSHRTVGIEIEKSGAYFDYISICSLKTNKFELRY